MRKITLLLCFMLVAFLPGQAQIFNPPQSNQDVVHVVSSFTATNTPNPVAVNRSFIVHFPHPAGSPSNIGLPLVFVYHGRGMTASPLQSQTEQANDRGADMQNYTKFDLTADREKFIVVYPVSLNKNWADGRGNPSDDQGVDDFDFFDKMLAKLVNDYQIDETKVYACGLSNGGFMSQALGVKRGNKLAAIGVVAATMGSGLAANFAPQRQLPVAMICGTADLIVPYQDRYAEFLGAEEARNKWLDHNACAVVSETLNYNSNKLDASRVELFKYNACDASSEVWFYKVTGGGHTWPGAPSSGLGATNRDINATDELWKFFNRHSISPASNPIAGLRNTSAISLASPVPLQVLAYPNPAEQLVNIFNIEANETVVLSNLNGQHTTVNMVRKANNELQIDLTNLPKGFYYLKTSKGKHLSLEKR